MTNTSGFKQKVPHLPSPPPPTNKKGEITSAIKHRQALQLARKQRNTELSRALRSSSSKTGERPSFPCAIFPLLARCRVPPGRPWPRRPRRVWPRSPSRSLCRGHRGGPHAQAAANTLPAEKARPCNDGLGPATAPEPYRQPETLHSPLGCRSVHRGSSPRLSSFSPTQQRELLAMRGERQPQQPLSSVDNDTGSLVKESQAIHCLAISLPAWPQLGAEMPTPALSAAAQAGKRSM